MGGGVPSNTAALNWARTAARRIAGAGSNVAFSVLLSTCIAEFLPILGQIPRTTTFLEVFSGAGRTARNIIGAGFAAHTFEMLDSEFENGCDAVHGIKSLPALTPSPTFLCVCVVTRPRLASFTYCILWRLLWRQVMYISRHRAQHFCGFHAATPDVRFGMFLAQGAVLTSSAQTYWVS
eukprot:6527269-Pyramimonas_sp.AAC.1